MRTTASPQSGSALVVTLIVLGALTVLGLGTIFLAGADTEAVIATRTGDQALYVAEAGINWGIKKGDENRAIIAAGYKTVSLGGTEPDPIIHDGTANVVFPGGQAASAGVEVGPGPDSRGQSFYCGIPGYSERFGSPRFKVYAEGKGPSNAVRAVEAYVLLPPEEGVCPPGQQVIGGYAGGG